jgi:Protein of unknown function (DUF3309)
VLRNGVWKTLNRMSKLSRPKGLPDGAVQVDSMLGIILIVVVVALIAGAFPRWNHSRSWGYYPSGGLGLVLIILVVLLLLGRI